MESNSLSSSISCSATFWTVSVTSCWELSDKSGTKFATFVVAFRTFISISLSNVMISFFSGSFSSVEIGFSFSLSSINSEIRLLTSSPASACFIWSLSVMVRKTSFGIVLNKRVICDFKSVKFSCVNLDGLIFMDFIPLKNTKSISTPIISDSILLNKV